MVQIVERGGDKAVHPSQQVVPRNHIIEVELIEQPALDPDPVAPSLPIFPPQ